MKLMRSVLPVIVLYVLCGLVLTGCGKKENPNSKFIGTYDGKDTWGSSKPEIGSGSLEYTITIEADGEDGKKVILNNINKTLDGVKGTVSGDSLIIEKQIVKSKAGSTYQVDNAVGTITGKELKIDFGYDDLEYGNAIGYVFTYVSGTKKDSKEDTKEDE